VYGTVVDASVGSVDVSGRVLAIGWTDHFMAEGGLDGDGTVVAADSAGGPSGGGVLAVSLSVTSHNRCNNISAIFDNGT
jgi:hypothetical protein